RLDGQMLEGGAVLVAVVINLTVIAGLPAGPAGGVCAGVVRVDRRDAEVRVGIDADCDVLGNARCIAVSGKHADRAALQDIALEAERPEARRRRACARGVLRMDLERADGELAGLAR